jgi:hypothetical protein
VNTIRKSLGKRSVRPPDTLWNKLRAHCPMLLTAKYSGSGGRPIKSGMVVEEPDIEIGAGFSSMATSRRIAASTGGKRGRNSDGFGGGRGGRPDRNGFGLRRN